MTSAATNHRKHDVPPASLRPFPAHYGSARPVAQDRWERIVSSVVIPARLEKVWDTLVSPSALGQWLAVTTDRWASEGQQSVLDFEDGEYFWCLTDVVDPPSDAHRRAVLRYRWRWLGCGPATEVEWELSELDDVTAVTVTESAFNGPADWRSWNGMGWPGILDQLADHTLNGRYVRWTWRRMGPYVQTELPLSTFEAWSVLTSVPALQFWMGRATGSLTVNDPMTFIMGDATGLATADVTVHVEANQRFPSYQPSLDFTLGRPGWPGPLQAHLWIEPAGFGQSLLQVFHSGWEIFGPVPVAPPDRALLANFWVGAFGRLNHMISARLPESSQAPGGFDPPSAGPHSWSR